MTARAIWKGVLQLEGEEVPVKLYSALENVRVSFRLLSRADNAPVRQVMIDPENDKVVEHEDTGKAYRSGDRLVELSDADLEELEPEPSREISLLSFVPPETIDHRWYERPYWLGPDGDEDSWSALSTALANTGLTGIARWVMRKKQYVGALRLREGRPLLITMRHAGEVIPLEDVDFRADSEIDQKQLKMAQQLIAMLEGEFEHESLVDEYRESVLDLIERKQAGKTVRRRRPAERPELADLSAALERSLKREKADAP